MLPYIYTWGCESGGEVESNQSENKSLLVFEEGEGTITASATRPMKLDTALLFSVLVWFFGISTDTFVRTCSPVDRVRKLFQQKKGENRKDLK